MTGAEHKKLPELGCRLGPEEGLGGIPRPKAQLTESQDGLGRKGDPEKGSQDLITEQLDDLDSSNEMLVNMHEMMLDVWKDLDPDMWKNGH